jgi:hypothetical protein
MDGSLRGVIRRLPGIIISNILIYSSNSFLYVLPMAAGTAHLKPRTGGDALPDGNTSMKSISLQNGFANVPVSLYR